MRSESFTWTPDHFNDKCPTLGDLEITVSLGDVGVRFEGLPQELRNGLLEQYGPFAGMSEAAHRVSVSRGSSGYLDPHPENNLILEEHEFEEGNILLSTGFAAFHPSDGGSGLLRLSTPGDVRLSLLAFENYLRWTIPDLILEGGGFILHGSGLVRDGRAYLFFGPSGAGKSTVAALSAEMAILSDDLIWIQSSGDEFVANTTPFRGRFAQDLKHMEPVPIAGFYRLHQSDQVRLEKVSSGIASGMLLSCCPFIAESDRRRRLLLPLLEKVVLKEKVFRLYFQKNDSFWEAIPLGE